MKRIMRRVKGIRIISYLNISGSDGSSRLQLKLSEGFKTLGYAVCHAFAFVFADDGGRKVLEAWLHALSSGLNFEAGAQVLHEEDALLVIEGQLVGGGDQA